jgi:N-acetylmuramidase
MERTIANETWRTLAQALDVEEAALRAVAAVESAGDGFLPPPSDLPKVLFEGHAFHRLTQGRFDADHPTLSYRKWTKQYYSRTSAGEWQRLNAACGLNRAAALQSASWGMFQIMGFNYALCGFSDVEAFVARQRAGAAEQLECFAQFISRQVFLSALRAFDWAKFAAAYNGPGYAANQYDKKLAAAYARFSKAPLAAAAGAVGRAMKKLRPTTAGRRDFAPVPAQRIRARRRPVKPDRVDLRDWYYRPSITRAPPPVLMPHNPRFVADQGDTSACTGFALATTIEYLLDRAGRPIERISGHMLYSMARRYDEWAGNENQDEGSSLRGALKGWSRHGASALKLWQRSGMPKATNGAEDWWLDSMRRPLGAYYRLPLDVESDLHCALMDVGVIYASALTHSGWDALTTQSPLDPPTTPEEIPVIECRQGDEDGGHAFAIVGYTSDGFIVHNSWGTRWGRGGLGVLRYADWRQNAMDCWVAQLGVVTLEHQRVAQASTLRLAGEDESRPVRKLAGSPTVVLSSDPQLANHEISPFVIDMQNEGRLSERGRFRTSPADLAFLLEHHLLQQACVRWGIGRNDTIDVAIYAHGGLVGEEAAARSARQWIPLLYGNRIFPIFLMWETDGLSTIFNLVEDALRGDDERVSANWLERFRDRVIDWKNERIEGLTRKPGGAMWRQMKDNADDISSTRRSGVVLLFQELIRLSAKAHLPKLRLHLIGHSAGAIVQSHLAPRAIERGFEVASLNLLAPALRVDDFASRLGEVVRSKSIRVLVAHLNDATERADPTCKPYGHSLLYLVSRAFEAGGVDVPLLGMERHLVPAVASHAWGPQISRLSSPGIPYRANDPLTEATSHGGLDDDIAVQDAVIRHIKGKDWTERVVRNGQMLRNP